MAAGRTVPTFTVPMLACWLLFATVPFWIERVGLYQYLGVEILIFAIYALAFNLVLGHAGLPSFGHGAFFGIGAYAFGLAQFNLAAKPVGLPRRRRRWRRRSRGALVALFISHRRGIYYALMTIAFGQVFWFIAIKAHSITGGEDGLLKIERLPATLGVAAFDLKSNVALYYFVLGVFVAVSLLLWRAGAFAVRARGQSHQAERDARPLRRLRRVALQGRGAGHLGGPVGACRRTVRHGADLRLPRRHEPALFGLRGDDDAGRRRPRLVLGAGDRRRRVLPRPRRDRRADDGLDAVVRPVLRACWCCSSRRASPACSARRRRCASASAGAAHAASPQPQAR